MISESSKSQKMLWRVKFANHPNFADLLWCRLGKERDTGTMDARNLFSMKTTDTRCSWPIVLEDNYVSAVWFFLIFGVFYFLSLVWRLFAHFSWYNFVLDTSYIPIQLVFPYSKPTNAVQGYPTNMRFFNANINIQYIWIHTHIYIYIHPHLYLFRFSQFQDQECPQCDQL